MRGSRLLLLLLCMAVVQCDIFHYYKLKKFLTAVAFARALGKRPTILPIPIPIPIPISQNEVIKLPASSANSFLASYGGSPKYSSGGGSHIFTGSSNFGYSLPGKADYSSTSSLGGSNIMVLDGNSLGNNFLDGGDDLQSSPNIIRLVSSKPQNFFRRPRPIFLSGGTRTMRNSDYPTRTVMHFEKKLPPEINQQKRPIPVGERFRMP